MFEVKSLKNYKNGFSIKDYSMNRNFVNLLITKLGENIGERGTFLREENLSVYKMPDSIEDANNKQTIIYSIKIESKGESKSARKDKDVDYASNLGITSWNTYIIFLNMNKKLDNEIKKRFNIEIERNKIIDYLKQNQF